MGLPSPMTRPPKPMTLPAWSWIGNITRFQNLSCRPLFSSNAATPASRIASSGKPFSLRCAVRSLDAPSAKPSPKLFIVSFESCLPSRYRRPAAPFGDRSIL